jgi:branched-subunit amino acid transport protein
MTRMVVVELVGEVGLVTMVPRALRYVPVPPVIAVVNELPIAGGTETLP